VVARQAIFSLLETEINKAMLARGNEEYAFKVLDPAFAPEKPSSLHPAIWTAIGVAGGLFLSLVAVLLGIGVRSQ
jgi:uncharacterized protein involved in exopolysaccharide biosynthesis